MKNIKQKKIINLPSVDINSVVIGREDMERIAKEEIEQITTELSRGLELIKKYPKSVTIFGSARFKEDHPYYQKARELGNLIAQTGFAVVTGGGPGAMEGANRGAFEANGVSLGLTIELPTEQVINPYVNGNEDFQYFFTRKVCLSFSAEVFVYMPGGYGTLDEFFEMITLIQTKKIPTIPIILFGSEYWNPLDNFIRNVLLKQYETISEGDEKLYTITDDFDVVLDIIKKAPVRITN